MKNLTKKGLQFLKKWWSLIQENVIPAYKVKKIKIKLKVSNVHILKQIGFIQQIPNNNI